MVEFVIRKEPFVFEVKSSKGQHRSKVNNLGEISKFLNFHPIDLKFEDDIYCCGYEKFTKHHTGPSV